MTTINDVTTLEDRPLLDAAKRLAADERRATAALLRVLMEIDGRRLYLGEGFASMFTYCTQVLHLAEGAAYNRIEAARAARSYPVILDLFEQSAITLTAVRLLAPHLTAENHAAVLTAARHQPKREIESLVAALRPKPDAVMVIRKVSVPRTETQDTPLGIATAERSPRPMAAPTTAPVASMPAPRAATPLTPDRYRIQLTVSRVTHDTLRRAQSLLRHAVPSGDPAEIIGRALTLLVEDLERKRFAATTRPRVSSPPAEGTRHIPAAVRRAVWRRDEGRCAFVGASGRCRETGFLEFHHVVPFAAGGEATMENVVLHCRAHNAHEAFLFFSSGGIDVVKEVGEAWR